ncbi:hypothetical protein T492DRAFT_1079675, partial [Pavlovales sp. CCMP2436]
MGQCCSSPRKPTPPGADETTPIYFNNVLLPRGSRPEDLASLELFCARAPDCGYKDYPRALRFIRARKHVLDDALKLWCLDQEWRVCDNIAGILDEPVDPVVENVIAAHYAPVLLGTRSREGDRLVMYRNVGDLNVETLNKATGVDTSHLLRRHMREMERLRREMDADAKGAGALGGHVSILDCEGTSVLKFVGARAFWTSISSLDGNHFAEMLGALIIINPPPMTMWAVNTIKPWM